MCPSATGKSFFKRKRQPIPIDCTRNTWKTQVETATQSTYMFQPAGNTVSIKWDSIPLNIPFRHIASPPWSCCSISTWISHFVCHICNSWLWIRFWESTKTRTCDDCMQYKSWDDITLAPNDEKLVKLKQGSILCEFIKWVAHISAWKCRNDVRWLLSCNADLKA